MFDNNVMTIETFGLADEYRVELHTGTEQGDERSDCTITREWCGTTYGGSLQLFEGDGGLYDDCENFLKVDPVIISEIYEWAEDNGY